jgi:hypothetical protein
MNSDREEIFAGYSGGGEVASIKVGKSNHRKIPIA